MRRAIPIVLTVLAVFSIAAATRRRAVALRRESLRPIASMTERRAVHTSTTLLDGRVLIVGGFGSSERGIGGAELFDPATESFIPGPGMVTRRQSQTATLLRDGRVLILGGFDSGLHALSSAEVFDPATNRFVALGRMTTSRAGHEATVLSDGRILIAGGTGSDNSPIDSAEIFDPASGTSSSTGRMTIPRESHVAVLLRDGRVFIAGGHRRVNGRIQPDSSTEIFDPVSGRFTRAASMSVIRHKHDGLLLPDGRVLVIGGADERDDRGVYRSVEIFDPATNTFSAGPDISEPRYKHRATSVLLPNGDVFLAGGYSDAEIYDLAGAHSRVLSSPVPLSGQFSASSLLRDGRVLITGGYGNGRGPTEHAWIFTPGPPQ